MKSACVRLSILSLCAVLLGGSWAVQSAEPTTAKELASFGTLRPMDTEVARTRALEWLKSTGKMDEAAQRAFDVIWAQPEQSVFDKTVDTIILGSPDAAQLLAEARDPNAPAPKEVPSLLKDTKLNAFFRANLATAYAKALTSKRVYEEALEALRGVRPEYVVDPATYLFHKAVAEHVMLHKQDATRTIVRLLDDVPDAPERYKMVAALMFLDMQQWKEKDLAEIGRKMTNIERRLDLARGGPQTQKLQKDVLARLDEIIKKLENQQKGSGSGNGGSCPSGGQQPGDGSGKPGDNKQASSPQKDSFGGTATGPGHVDPKKLKELVDGWGKLPEKDRVKAMTEMIRDMPPSYRQMIEDYYKRTASAQPLP